MYFQNHPGKSQNSFIAAQIFHIIIKLGYDSTDPRRYRIIGSVFISGLGFSNIDKIYGSS